MILHKITFLLLVIGGLNWLVLAITGVELGSLFGGQTAIVSRVMYFLVGLSALYMLVTFKSYCKNCGGKRKKRSTVDA